DDARRLPLPRPPRPGALRRSRARPARQAALVLPDGSPAARGRGGTRRARADRVAGARLRARGGGRGGPAPPRAAAAGERGLRDRVEALERVVAELQRVRALRRAECCLVVPALEAGFARAVFVSGGRVAAVRSVPPGLGARLEVDAGLAACRLAEPSARPEDVDDLLLVGT